jgi:hypothetical protein
MREKFQPFINICAPRQFSLPGQSLRRAAGHRAGATFFAHHLDSFVMTLRFSGVYRDLALTQFIRNTKLSTIYRDWQKNVSPRRGRQLIKSPGR